VHAVLRLRGGGSPPKELSVAAGGLIHQVIHPDHKGDEWLKHRTTVFNVQILNSVVYRAVTGLAPPTQPLDAQYYKDAGMPFYKVYEEPSGVSGDFGKVKSVGQIDNNTDEVVTPTVVTLGAGDGRITGGLIDPDGPLREFRTLRDLEMELENLHFADL
jgi:hypothetical protein